MPGCVPGLLVYLAHPPNAEHNVPCRVSVEAQNKKFNSPFRFWMTTGGYTLVCSLTRRVPCKGAGTAANPFEGRNHTQDTEDSTAAFSNTHRPAASVPSRPQ